MTANPNAYYAGGLGVELYDLFTGGGLLAGDVEFYVESAQRFGGPILELGTGTARVLIPLAGAGHEVVGLDLSRPMLGQAAAKLRERPDLANRVRLVEADMTSFDLEQRFALALVPARSFQHVVTPEGQRNALNCIHQHLIPGGHLILDLFDPNFEMLFGNDSTAPPREARHPGSGHLIRRTVIARHTDPFRQTVHETLRFERFDAAGNVVGCEETSWLLRWSLRQETAYLLELTGFEVVDLYSGFSRSPPDYGREQLWIARAKSGNSANTETPQLS
ncbi:methyltransferase domain-containing protein [Sinorhizobium meliloti]|nr:methyltransferase domain-containing protein [Sinorhizobium meliloti]MDX0584567.1 methyltransferase domain-containing protein [Sinorhizobium medicae]